MMTQLTSPLRRMAKLALGSVRFNRPLTLEGKTFKIPVIQNQGWVNLREYEPDMTRLIARLLRIAPGAVVDVGTNLGQTLLKVKAADPARAWIGFEASLFCCYYVTEMMQLNAMEDVTLIPIGLSEERGLIELFSSDASDAQATTLPDFWTARNAKSHRSTIYVERGDTVLESLAIDAVALVKVDVEGAELEVLRGIKRTLERFRPFVITEILPYTASPDDRDPNAPAIMAKRRDRAEMLRDLMEAHGYRFLRLMPGGELVPQREFNMQVFDERLTNYLICPEERLSTL
jgi:FkbM family methyltransferase